MIAVCKREFRSCMRGVVGFLFAAVLLCLTGLMVAYFNFLGGLSDITYCLSFGEYALIIMVPILCMRSMAEDKKNKTDMFYLSLPIKPSSVVLGKYLALLAVFTIPVGVLCLYPLIFSIYGPVSFASAYTSLLAFYLMGAGLIALCMFLSSLTDHLVVAAVLGVGVLAVLYLLPLLASVLPGSALTSLIGFAILAILAALIAWFTSRSLTVSCVTAAALVLILAVVYIVWPELLADAFPLFLVAVSPFAQFSYMAIYSLFDLTAIAVFVSYAVFFVFLTVKSADRKRYM